ncbi:hypothetical protein EV641_105238 [Rhodococcus sp. SMB37]|nr:hypothetical protein EV641_105238 [Rhodococcus sp. SMB37]
MSAARMRSRICGHWSPPPISGFNSGTDVEVDEANLVAGNVMGAEFGEDLVGDQVECSQGCHAGSDTPHVLFQSVGYACASPLTGYAAVHSGKLADIGPPNAGPGPSEGTGNETYSTVTNTSGRFPVLAATKAVK